MANFVDSVAMTMPWAGGLIPATLTYQNLVSAGFQPWQSAVVAGVVEGMGFVTVTTAVDLWEADQLDQRTTGSFWMALAGAMVYLVAVLVINVALDAQASIAQRVTGGILSTFGVVGGLFVALRNQLGKRRQTLVITESRARQAEAESTAREHQARERQHQFQLERERIQLAFEQKVREDQMRMDQEFRLKKLEENSKKLSVQAAKVIEQTVKVVESIPQVPETFEKWPDWRKVPESERQVIANLENAEQVSALYGGSLKTCSNWLAAARKDYLSGSREQGV